MLDVSVLIESLNCSRLSDKISEDSASNYALNVSLSERDRNPSSLILSFTLELTNQPQLAKIVLSGIATLTGSKEEIQGATTASGEAPPAILTTIYERVYGLVYLVAGGVKIPHPMPTLLKAGSEKK